MRNVFLLFTHFTLAITLAANAAAQSGRRITNPPTPKEPATEMPPEPLPERLPSTPTEASVLPESLRKRELQAIDKGSFRLADFSGKVIVLNLLASWCGPCRMEIPDYEEVRQEYSGGGVEFIGLTTEDPRTASARVNKFVREFHFGFRLGWADPKTALTLMNGSQLLPQTLVIAPDGRIVSHWRGYSPTESLDRLRATIKRALAY